MCGISGIIDQSGRAVDRADIQAMNDLIAHRGPDGEGYFFGNQFAFGHRRLAIIDLSPGASQPMTFKGKYTIVYNGEVYNYIELREELMRAGVVFQTRSDVEVILAAYERWGFDCVKRFNGMWAFAIFDSERSLIFCSRDRFGVKPFYYAEVSGRFIFASEIKPLLRFLPDPRVNRSVLMDYLILGYEDHTPETFFAGIRKLPPSHNLIYDLKTQRFQLQKYYELTTDSALADLDEAATVTAFREALNAGIQLRLRSDVKVGTCLSGGLDSSSVAALSARSYRGAGAFVAVHAQSSEQRSDESRFAARVAEHCGLELHVIKPATSDFVERIDEIIGVMEEPFQGPSVFMQYFVMKLAGELHCKVMLDGQGGDETLLGYERHYAAAMRRLGLLDKAKALLAASQRSRCSLRELLFHSFYFPHAGVIWHRQQARNSFVKKEYVHLANRTLLAAMAQSFGDIAAMQRNELFVAPLPALLRYADKNSMRHSIEIRLPFIDYRTAETALSLNDRYKIRAGWTKYVLRKAVVRDHVLPDEIAWRRDKVGFEAPDSAWIDAVNGQLPQLLGQSGILSEIIKTPPLDPGKLDKQQKWKLFNIAKWEKAYGVGI